MLSVGVTGTNGKTSTVGLLVSALGALGRPVMSTTTLGSFLDHELLEVPRSWDGSRRAAEVMRERGGHVAVLEMTSEALALGAAQVWPCQGAVFTNLTHDHLDAHRSPEHYLASKAQLFVQLPPGGFAVLNGCSEPCSLIREIVPEGVRVLHYGVRSRGEPHTELDVEAVDVETSWLGTSARLIAQLPGIPERLTVRAIGEVYLENALAALLGAVAAGVQGAEARDLIAEAPTRPGRFEVISTGPAVVIDFAHSPDALERTLRAARSLTKGLLTVVFGAGGNRDRDKRRPMGEAARLADRVMITNDNPRSESPEDIAHSIAQGLVGHPHSRILLDRASAIEAAIAESSADDTVIIAGRGPEAEQIFGTEKVRLVDAEVARRALSARSS